MSKIIQIGPKYTDWAKNFNWLKNIYDNPLVQNGTKVFKLVKNILTQNSENILARWPGWHPYP